MKKYNTSLFVLLFVLPFAAFSQLKQQKVVIVFAEDKQILIPKKFQDLGVTQTESINILPFHMLKYEFYNVFSQRLVENGFLPIGGVNEDINTTRSYKEAKWVLTDTAKAKDKKKKTGYYLSAVVNENNRNWYAANLAADSAAYLISINKIEIHTNIFRNIFYISNYMMDVHFDVYDKDMKHLGGQYLRKKVRLSSDMYWASFYKQFSALPDEMALYFINMKK